MQTGRRANQESRTGAHVSRVGTAGPTRPAVAVLSFCHGVSLTNDRSSDPTSAHPLSNSDGLILQTFRSGAEHEPHAANSSAGHSFGLAPREHTTMKL